MEILIVNDCSPYHYGCIATIDILKNKFSQYGNVTTIKVELGGLNLEDFDLIVVNGEGSFHHDLSRASIIYSISKKAKDLGKKVCLINTVIDSISFDLSIYDYIATRESFSSGELYDVVPDVCFDLDVSDFDKKSSHVLFVDSVLYEPSDIARKCHSKFSGKKKDYIRLYEHREKDVLEYFARAKFVVTGRYHGVIWALLFNKPFLAFKSNSHKTEGLLHDFGLSENLIEDFDPSMVHNKKPNINIEEAKIKINNCIQNCIDLV